MARSPGNRTLTQLKDELRRFVKLPDDSEAATVAGDAVNEAIGYLNHRTWNFNVIYQDISFVAGIADYAVSGVYKAPRHMELLNSSSKATGRRSYLDPKTFKYEYPNRATNGEPIHYTVTPTTTQNSFLISLSKPPSSDFISTYPTARFWYYSLIQEPASDSDTVDVPYELEHTLMWKAKMYMATIYGDRADYGAAEREFNRHLNEAKKFDRLQYVTDWE